MKIAGPRGLPLWTWFAGIVAAVFAAALLAFPRLGGGWFWSIGIGFGLACLACMIYLAIDVRAGGKVRMHQVVSYGAAGFLAAHVLWLLIGDSAALEYAKPGAPWHMWSAWLALVLLVVLVVSSLPGVRKGAYRDSTAFRRWHWALTVAMLAAAIHHVLSTDFHFTRIRQSLTIIALAVVAVVFRITRSRDPRPADPLIALAVCLLAIVAFAAIGNLEI
jgi:hypothetical protein